MRAGAKAPFGLLARGVEGEVEASGTGFERGRVARGIVLPDGFHPSRGGTAGTPACRVVGVPHGAAVDGLGNDPTAYVMFEGQCAVRARSRDQSAREIVSVGVVTLGGFPPDHPARRVVGDEDPVARAGFSSRCRHRQRHSSVAAEPLRRFCVRSA